MKIFRLACFLFVVAALALPAMAQNPTDRPLSTTGSISLGELTPTPDMWFYEQYRQEKQSPKELVHNRAMFRAELRERRLAAMKFFGFSAARPWASSDPWNAPVWKSNHFFYPRLWSGLTPPAVIVQQDAYVPQTD